MNNLWLMPMIFGLTNSYNLNNIYFPNNYLQYYRYGSDE